MSTQSPTSSVNYYCSPSHCQSMWASGRDRPHWDVGRSLSPVQLLPYPRRVQPNLLWSTKRGGIPGVRNFRSHSPAGHPIIVISASLYRRDYPCRWWESLNPRHSTPPVKLFELITISPNLKVCSWAGLSRVGLLSVPSRWNPYSRLYVVPQCCFYHGSATTTSPNSELFA